MYKSKDYPTKINRVKMRKRAAEATKILTKPRTIDEMLAIMKKPNKKAKETMQDEGTVIYFHQEW